MATSNLQFVITNAGLQAVANAQSGGPAVNITTFQVGSAYAYNPTATMSGLQGTSLYSGLISGYSVDSLNQVTYLLNMNQTVGTFQFGEVGVYLSNGTLFALAAFTNLQEKVAASSSNAGNLVTLLAKLLLSGIAPTISFTNLNLQNAILLEVPIPDGLPVPNAPNSSNIYSVQSGDDSGRAVLAVRETTASLWSFNTHYPYLTTHVTSVGSTTQTNCSSIVGIQFSSVAGRYLVQFTSGLNAGVVRNIASIGNGQFTTTALPYTAQVNDNFVIYRSLSSIATQLTTRTVYGVDSGSTNNYVVTSLDNTSSTLKDGMQITFIPLNTCSGASTLAYNGNTALQILRGYAGGIQTTVYDDLSAGIPATVVYGAAGNVFYLTNPKNYAQLNGDRYQPFTAQGLTVTGINDGNGAELLLQGNGSNPNKTLRANSGSFQVINNVYSQALLTLTDSGNLSIYGSINGASAYFGGVTTSYGSTNLAIGADNNGVAFPNYYQGMHVTWNHIAGNGETDLVAYQGGGGTGGFAFYNQNSSNVATLLGTLNASGLNVPAITSTGTIQGHRFFADESSGATAGYTFTQDGAWDTGMYSPSDGVLNFFNNSVNTFSSTPDSFTLNVPTTFNQGTQFNSTIQLADGQFLQFGPTGDNSDTSYFYRNNNATDITVINLMIGDNGGGVAVPEPSLSNDGNGTDYFAIRSTNGTVNGIHHRFGTDGTYVAGSSIYSYGSFIDANNNTFYVQPSVNSFLNTLTTNTLTVNGNVTFSGASRSIVWSDSNTAIYEDSSGQGPGDLVIRTGTGGTNNVFLFASNGSLSVDGAISTYNGNIFANNPSGQAAIGATGAGQASAYLFNHATQWGLFSDAGGLMAAYTRSTDRFAFNGTAATLGQGGGASNTAMTFNWAGQNGQPTWLWGGNDGVNMYVWNPSNFNVNYANSAGSVGGVGNPAAISWFTAPVASGASSNGTVGAGFTVATYINFTAPQNGTVFLIGTNSTAGSANWQLQFLLNGGGQGIIDSNYGANTEFLPVGVSAGQGISLGFWAQCTVGSGSVSVRLAAIFIPS